MPDDEIAKKCRFRTGTSSPTRRPSPTALLAGKSGGALARTLRWIEVVRGIGRAEMKWKMEFPRSLRARLRQKTQESGMVGLGDGDAAGRKIALQLTIRGDIIDMRAHPDIGESFAVEELAKGFDPCHISLFLDNLTSVSPLVWLAAVEERDVNLTVEVTGVDGTLEKAFQATIDGGTIVPLRALFDKAQIAMTSGCSIDLRLFEDSGPIRVYRQVRRFRRLLH